MPSIASNSAAGGNDLVEQYRRACLWIVAVSVSIAAAFAIGCDVAIDPSGTAVPAALLAALIFVSARLQRSHFARPADCFGTLGLMWLGGLAGGALSLLGLRLGMPIVDDFLHAADLSLGLDGRAFAAWIADRPGWHPLMVAAYDYTVAVLSVSVAAVALSGDRVEAWRAAFCFVGTLLSVCLIALLTPARGLGVWIIEDLFPRLPHGAMRYFWPHFDAFYAGDHPTLGLSSVDGVVSFPSYHIVMGLITIMLWRKGPIRFGLAMAWFIPMLAATVPFGGHYFIDLIGGAAVWAAWYALSVWMERRTPAPHTDWSPPHQSEAPKALVNAGMKRGRSSSQGNLVV